MMNFPNPKDPQTVQVRICNEDNDCGKGNLCSFNDEKLVHQCIPEDKKLLYQGCLNTSKYNEYSKINFDNKDKQSKFKFEKIDSKSSEDHDNIKSCIDFTRRQKNKNGFHYNYMIFKNKKNAFVDPNTINLYLKCDNEVLMAMPSKDFFNMKCSEDQKHCVLIPNKTFKSFVQSNTKTCGGKFSLDVEYACENEDLQNKFNVKFNPKKLDELKIELNCPVNLDDSRFQSQCTAAYFDTDNSNPDNFKFMDLLDKNVKAEDCVQPVYKVPRIVNDIDIYKQLMTKKKEDEVLDYNKMLDDKEDELNRIRAEKLKIKYKINTGKDLDYDDARRMVEFNKTEYFQSGSEKPCLWKIHEHKHPLGEYIEENDIRQYATQVQGNYHLIEEAKQKACELNAHRFIWFSNTYPLESMRNELYVFTPKQWDNVREKFSIDDIKKWKKVSNVYVGEPTTETDIYKEKFFDAQSELNQTLSDNYNLFVKFYQDNVEKTDDKLNNNENTINELDDKITTMTQKIKMNQIESDVNNEFLRILLIVFVVLVFCSIAYYVYKRNHS